MSILHSSDAICHCCSTGKGGKKQIIGRMGGSGDGGVRKTNHICHLYNVSLVSFPVSLNPILWLLFYLLYSPGLFMHGKFCFYSFSLFPSPVHGQRCVFASLWVVFFFSMHEQCGFDHLTSSVI